MTLLGSKHALMVGALHQPRTPEGRELLEIIAGQLPNIEAAAARHDREGSFPAEILKSLIDAGVLRATVPRELGGLGLGSVHDVCLAVMRLAEADPSVALCLHMQLSRGLTMSYELAHGTDVGRRLAERILRLMGNEDAVVSGALKDAGAITRLIPAAGGGWTLHGRKILVSMAPVATHFVVQAETRPVGGEPRLASVFVPAGAEGLSVPDNWDGMGMRASASSEVIFDGCSIPETDLFLRGPVGARNDAALAGQAVSSIGLLGVYAGIAQASRDIAVNAAARRKGPLSGGVGTLLAELDAKLYCLRATLAAALDNTDHYAHHALENPAERGRVMMAPFQYAKLTVNRNASAIVEDAMTVVGGASFTSGHPLSRRYRDVRAGWFMQPYTYGDAVDFLSGCALES
ncbi:acyl-CoA dehydrogenase family protein [Streptomyces sp. NPDC003710]